jgi:prepilin-type N-terminal cleavage/methylation domain-containing protein
MKKGFTLVELLVSISIIILLSTIGTQTLYVSQKESRLDEDVSQVVIAIRQAQNASLAPSKSQTGVSGDEKLCSIGVQLKSNNNTIRKFYTTQDTPTTCSSEKFYGSSVTLQYSTINIIDTINFEFNIPFADTGSKSVKLSLSDLEKEIQVTSSGLINVK